MDDAAATARRLWALFEPVHVVSYLTAEARAAFEAAAAGQMTAAWPREQLQPARGWTDAEWAAARPWASLGHARTAGLVDLLLPITAACATAMPFPNPIGVPSPAAVHPPAA